MLQRLFPRQIDNAYRGQLAAIWLFAPVVAVKALMGFNVSGLDPLVRSRDVLMNADGVPVNTYAADAAAQLVFTFAAWGLALLVLSLLAIVVLLRYRAMLPLMILAMTIEQLGRKALSMAHLPAHEGAISIGAWINYGLSAALVLALILSLIPRRSVVAA